MSGTGIFIPVTNAIERLHEEFKRRIKTQTVLRNAETAAMLFWALSTSGPNVGVPNER
jgi:transposase-like protein